MANTRVETFENKVRDKNPLDLTTEELLGLIELKFVALHTTSIEFQALNYFGTRFNIEAEVRF